MVFGIGIGIGIWWLVLLPTPVRHVGIKTFVSIASAAYHLSVV